MSIIRNICALALSLGVLAAQDGPGVHVQVDSALLMHRSPVSYPAEAAAKGIGGTVLVQVKLDANGEVGDAAVLSGPDELRKAALQSVLNWHFTRDSTPGGARQIAIEFDPAKAGPPAAGAVRSGVMAAIVPPGDLRPRMQQTLRSIAVVGLADVHRDALLAQLPVHEGDVVDVPEALAKTTAAAQAFDEHLRVMLRAVPDGIGLVISTPDASQAPQGALRVGANVQAANLINKTQPFYPPLAKQARVQGIVRFEATIGPDGTVQNLNVIEGPPLLIQAAMQAVRQWVYKPTLLNGNPVPVLTTIDVNFTLAE